ncbi:A24 family peptidase [Paenibacillus popilliae]|uniref:Flp pilus assembly protein n=1 Tax=Paenibacillus popilliae ATCC 14706 TaxID=1212764 RepID=M9LZN5_PAEPP|nr:A24 family peptidase [Paenibacillus popilliae]GAC41799.1 Flp pilus assembly protein [Paenibacillus popilliae ATCC 14706]
MNSAIWTCGVLLLAAFATDVRTHKIPNRLTMLAVAAGFIIHGAANGWQGLVFSGLGAGSGFGIMLLLYIMKAVGAGDVKLFAAIGALTGMYLTWQIFIFSILYGGLIAAYIMLCGCSGRIRSCWPALMSGWLLRLPVQVEAGRQATFPFMWAVLPGALTAYLTVISPL